MGRHYHPTGALYFVVKGVLYYSGDSAERALPTRAGEVKTTAGCIMSTCTLGAAVCKWIFGLLVFTRAGPAFSESNEFYCLQVRWVRPGHAYGPEYNDGAEAEFTVIGFDTTPVPGDPPAGPYKMQKNVTITHIFDEL